MTDDEIRAVFAELRRVGVDLGRPPGLALSTGFRDGEFLAWLRELPDALGHDPFVERLAARVDAAQPNAGSSLPNRPDGRPHRLWPTVEQLNAAIDVLVAEWDPLGARLGQLPREAVMHHAQNMLGIVLHGGDAERMERLISGQLGAVEQEVFEVRPSPRAQRRYLARRLIQVVVDQPGPAHDEDPFEVAHRAAEASMEVARAEGRLRETRTATGGSVTVCFGPRGDEPPAFDPTAACTECGAIGTVAFVGREVEPRYSRYCVSCWRTVRDRYWDVHFQDRKFAKPNDQSTPEELIEAFDRMGEMFLRARERVRGVGSAMWEDRGPMIESWLGRSEGESDADHDLRLRMLARDVAAMAPTMCGQMPPGLQELVRRYASTESPSELADDAHEPPARPGDA